MVSVLFLQKLSGQTLFLFWSASGKTNFKRDLGNTEGSFCDPIQLKNVNVLLVSISEHQPPRMQLRIEWLSLKPSPSTRSSILSNPSTNFRVHRATNVDISPMRVLIVGRDRKLQRDERYCLRRIVVLEGNDTFQRPWPLRFSIRYVNWLWTATDPVPWVRRL